MSDCNASAFGVNGELQSPLVRHIRRRRVVNLLLIMRSPAMPYMRLRNRSATSHVSVPLAATIDALLRIALLRTHLLLHPDAFLTRPLRALGALSLRMRLGQSNPAPARREHMSEYADQSARPAGKQSAADLAVA